MRYSDCHPDRKHFAKSKCATCYNKFWYESKTPEERLAFTAKRNATEAAKLRKSRWRGRNPGYSSLKHRLTRYGITLQDYEDLLTRQYGSCKICLRSFEQLKRVCVDHNHETGKVRALLCGQCNSALGLVREKEFILARLLAYLRWSATLPRLEGWAETDFVDLRPASSDRSSKRELPSP